MREGRVVDVVTGRGIPGVQVQILPLRRGPDKPEPLQAITNEHGDFAFPGGTVFLQKPGYPDISSGANGVETCCEWDYGINGRSIPGPFYYGADMAPA